MRILIATLLILLFSLPLFAGEVDLAWDAPAAPAAPTGYNIYRSANADGSSATKMNSAVIASTVLTYNDLTPVAPGTYYYYATAVYAAGESDKSNIVKAILKGAAPVNLKIASLKQ